MSFNLLLLAPSATRAGGGVTEAVFQTAQMFKAEPGFGIEVLALADPPGAAGAPIDWCGIPVETFPIHGPANYGFSPALIAALARRSPDVVHVHGIWQSHCLAMHLAHSLRGTPYVVTPHGMLEAWIRARSARLKGLVSALYQDRFLRRAAAVHILTEKERQDVEDAVPHPNCVLIPNAVSPPAPLQPKPVWWEPAMEGRTIYLFLGRLHEKKGCMELCAAWDLVCKETPGFAQTSQLVFCGPVDGLPDLESKVSQLRSRYGNALYAGPQYGDEKVRSLAAASFFCLPSKSEGLPIAVLEAWAAGVPAIITPECNLAVGFEAGAALRTGTDTRAIAFALGEASRLDTAEQAKMARDARTLVATRYAPEVVAGQMMELYQTAAKKPNR